MSQPCPICSDASTFVLWSKEDFELYKFPVADLVDRRSFRMDLTVHFCGRCHHGFLWPRPDNKALTSYYESGYDGHTSLLETGLDATRQNQACEYIASEIKRRFGRPVRIAEIGGHDGYVLRQLADLSQDSLLIEPGEEAAAIARRYEIPVLNEFLTDELAETYAVKFDVVISRHVLEHQRDPAAFIRQLRGLLAPDGVIMLEQPDLPVVLDELLVRVLILEHLNYFSPNSLHWVASKSCGMGIDQVEFLPSGFMASLTKNGDTLQTQISNGLRNIDTNSVILANANEFSGKLSGHNSKLKDLVSQWHGQSKRIWIWGAGSAGGKLFDLHGQDPEHFQGYIDSDEGKIGTTFPSAPELPIYTPDLAYERGIDAILITTASVDEVVRTIGQRGWKVDVASLYTAEICTIDS